jgi:hypothetical protein
MRGIALPQLFVGSGACLLAIVALALAGPRMRQVTDTPSDKPNGKPQEA